MAGESYMENITPEEIVKLELAWFRGKIVIVDNMEVFREVISVLSKEPVLGFDTETRPSFKKGIKNKVSIIQLASSDLACLFRIKKIGMPQDLIRILANPAIIKAGVAVHDDIRFLKNINGFNPAGFIDLQNFVREYGITSSGLKKLAAIVLGVRISKSQQVSDWAAEELTEAQKVYAATDAWVCREIYNTLVSKKQKLGKNKDNTKIR
jgi:ribonuclease D